MIHPYLRFNGDCREAVEFYSHVFQTDEPKMIFFGEVGRDPDHPLPESARNRVMHSELEILGSRVMFSDIFPGTPYRKGDQVSLAVVGHDEDQIRDAFKALGEGGQVDVELQKTDWSRCYGALTDRYGIAWQFNLQ